MGYKQPSCFTPFSKIRYHLLFKALSGSCLYKLRTYLCFEPGKKRIEDKRNHLWTAAPETCCITSVTKFLLSCAIAKGTKAPGQPYLILFPNPPRPRGASLSTFQMILQKLRSSALHFLWVTLIKRKDPLWRTGTCVSHTDGFLLFLIGRSYSKLNMKFKSSDLWHMAWKMLQLLKYLGHCGILHCTGQRRRKLECMLKQILAEHIMPGFKWCH